MEVAGMKYRSRNEIISKILNAANGGASKAKIMYQAFLSHNQLKAYVEILTKSDLLSYDEDTLKFKTTGKGLRLLDTYKKLSDFMKTPQQQYQL